MMFHEQVSKKGRSQLIREYGLTPLAKRAAQQNSKTPIGNSFRLETMRASAQLTFICA